MKKRNILVVAAGLGLVAVASSSAMAGLVTEKPSFIQDIVIVDDVIIAGQDPNDCKHYGC